jgi:hypothetical protein
MLKKLLCKLGIHKFSNYFKDPDKIQWRYCIRCGIETNLEGETEVRLK